MNKVVNIFEAKTADKDFWMKRYDDKQHYGYRQHVQSLSHIKRLTEDWPAINFRIEVDSLF